MKTLAFASRNSKEILRDRLNLTFGIGFPVVLLLLLTMIQSNIPVVLFSIDKLTPGIAVFGLSFISLFSGLLIAKDRSSSLMLRLFTAPLTSSDFIFGYTLPLLPMAILQVAVCFAVAFFLGLGVSINVVLAIIVLTPAAVLFIAIGLLCGSLFNEKQVGGVCGALLTNLSAWLSGTWFDLDLVGGAFKGVAGALPFVHTVKAGRAALSGNYSSIFPDLWWVIVYAVVIMVIAILVFTRKMNSDNT
ncbi:ABC transporter permease [Thermoanaerobacterium saccharolyticum]|uniref:ABC transporter permease n=1 Tax=Thermoanaerobacterium saccharolyticum TaxID=28896 RepID=UPI0005EF9B0F